ncbi:MAG: M36 family metallopeptidase [Pirellulaceae bacterium]|nr:M36 family metallopeptidase [Pirellulaceae bacterium]MDP6553532.1 M36 family metallopeptidase [Pirellulaceae bacterium]
MNSANRVQNRLKTTNKRRSSREASHRRRILFEQLEDRRLLALTVADFGAEGEGGFAPSHDGDHQHRSGLFYSAPRHYEGSTSAYLTPPRSGDPLTIAMSYLRQNASRFGLNSSDMEDAIVKSQYRSENTGVTHIALRQTHNDLEVQAADILVNVMSDGRILDVSSTFVPNLASAGVNGAQTSVGAAAAFSQFAQEFGFELDSEPRVVDFEGGAASKTILSTGGLAERNVVAELVYVPIDDGGQPGIELAWSLNVQMLRQNHWYSASMSAEGGGNLYFEDWVCNASYNALPIPNESPLDGTGREIIVDPHDPEQSPFGWHDADGRPGPEFPDTRGNNVDAREDRANNSGTTGNPAPTNRPNGGANLNFDFPLDLAQSPVGYTDASITNLFVWTNIAHDIFGKAGFTEDAGNFQATNYTRRGLEGDPVLALGQVADDGLVAGNNAFFATPPDGLQPTMSMFTIDLDLSDFIVDSANTGGIPPTYSPRRDFDFAPDVIIHEYGHGVTNRLTGGPANAGALNALQSGGMGEGWSDYFGLHVLQRPTDQKNDAYPVGSYVMGPNPLTNTGIRRFPYSFDMGINPLTYAEFNGGGFAIPNDEVHNSGEIWAQTLWDMQWLLIDKYGYDPDVYNGTGGNNLAFQLVMTGLTLQPANPSFLEARDAILRADFIENQGVNHKEIWEAFARRGMGFSADDDLTNGPIAATSNQVQAAFDMPPSPAFITGNVWDDINANGLDDNEPGIANWEVYIDLNNDGTRDPLEPSTLTDANGDYSFELYAPATLRIAETLQVGRSQTYPQNNGSHTVSVNGGITVDNVDFGIRDDTVQSKGVKFHDLDNDGRKDDGEPGIPGFWVYIDLDDDGRLDMGEPTAITQEDGTYELSIDLNGTFKVRELNMAGWIQTLPGGTEQAHTVSVTNGSLNLNLNFGNIAAIDYGDAPESYGTSIAADGASHGYQPGLSIGDFVDVEADGVPSDNADSDDLNQNVDDEDGVTFNTIFFPGSESEFEVTLATGTNSPARLNAWFDFNRDGDFDDAGEQVITADRKGTGTYTYTITVPDNAVPGLTYARFRYGYEGGIGPTGPARAGEVEDYVVRILSDTPHAVDDRATVDQDSNTNQILVLANDVSSLNGPIFVSAVGTPNRGGRVEISAGGAFVTYTPPIGFSGNETFSYTIKDGAGLEDMANVSVTIDPSRTEPLALDDSYEVQSGTSNNELAVLDNDLRGQNGDNELIDVTPASLGFVSIDRKGTPDFDDDVLLYTPNPGASGTDQFFYTIQDQRPVADGGPVQRSATVTVHIQPGDMADDLVQYRIQTVDASGTPTNTVLVGDQFGLQVYVKDLRLDDGDGEPIDRRGVAAGYLDVLYDSNFVSVAGNIVYGPDYGNVPSGNLSVPGLIDEVGAFQTGTNPLGAADLLLFSIPMNANARGSAVFKGDPADISPFNDTLLFEPPQPVDVQHHRFINTAVTGPELNHILKIENPEGLPQAVDNTFHVDLNSSENEFDVLANDVEPAGLALTITEIGTRSDGGTVLITNSGTTLSYSPRAGFNGTEQFTYTMQNADLVEATATVSVQVGTSAKDINIRLETTDNTGSVLTEIAQGSTFQLQVYVQDVRLDDGDGDGTDERGVFAGYVDLLLNSDLVSTIADSSNTLGFDVTFGPFYPNGQSGVSSTNIVDELGAFQASLNPLGPTEQHLATITLRADAAGVAEFFSDPADISPLHDSLLFEPTDPVDIDRINLGFTSITVTGGTGEGESPFQNPRNRHDVDDNGEVTPRDVLLVINRLNNHNAAVGEGEHGEMVYYDVNGDGLGTPIDALNVVNYLNSHSSSGSEGEGGLPELGDVSKDPASVLHNPPLFVSQPQYATRIEAATTPNTLVTAPAASQSTQPAVEDHNTLFADWNRDPEEEDGPALELFEALALDDTMTE